TPGKAPDIRAYLSGLLPQYMLPAFFINQETFPLTPNGKLDRKALPAPEIKRDDDYETPAGPVEEALAVVWRQVLNLNTLGVNDNFFNLGGDSIKIIQIASRLRKYRFKLDVQDLFTYQTIKQLAPHVKHANTSSPQHTVEGTVPLTPIQEWFFRFSFTDSFHFNQSLMIYREEGFEQAVVEAVFTRIIQHHDALRMVYEEAPSSGAAAAGTTIIQRNRGTEDALFCLDVFDFKNLTEKNIKKRIPVEASR
ncbi:MAG: non-ribosomal peptide synthetase, partial [bacterium]|nr:non-ribosomal peptide synthetase [bacterium]